MGLQASRKWSFRERILPAILRRLSRIGLRIDPFLTVREANAPVDLDPTHDTFRFDFLTTADVEELVELEPGIDGDELRSWFREGKLCFGARDGSRLIAKMWCDLDAFNFPPDFRKLADDEVYLFAAYAHPDYRGYGLAPLMRAAGYATLREMGRSKFYSYSDYSNTAARRFKAKLGAHEEALRLYIELFGKWSKTVTLRRYT